MCHIIFYALSKRVNIMYYAIFCHICKYMAKYVIWLNFFSGLFSYVIKAVPEAWF